MNKIGQEVPKLQSKTFKMITDRLKTVYCPKTMFWVGMGGILAKFENCRLIGQGQLRVIIYTNFVEIESPMLHAKLQDHRTFDSDEDFLPYIGVAAILVM